VRIARGLLQVKEEAEGFPDQAGGEKGSSMMGEKDGGLFAVDLRMRWKPQRKW